MCPACNQGRLAFLKNTTADKLYLHCEECEMGWDRPDQVGVTPGYLTIEMDFETAAPTIDEIVRSGFSRYIQGDFEIS